MNMNFGTLFKKYTKHRSLITVILTISVLIVAIFYISNRQKPIFIKDVQGPVSLSGFINLNTSRSSFIKEAWYKSSDQYLILKLNNTYYHYCNLPQNSWSAFENADSLGDFYNTQIKGRFECETNGLYPGNICLDKAIEESKKDLQLKGYKEASDGSWQDADGNYPGDDYDENANEENTTKVYLDCINSYLKYDEE